MSFSRVRRKRKVLVSILFIAVLFFTACALYLNDYYKADEGAVFPLDNVSTLDNGNMVFESKNSENGLIFYPGGKVEYTAYYPLMAALAEKGITCILVKMPFNLAVFDIKAADGIKDDYPQIKNWYIGGHSLGGSMAAYYIKNHTEEFDGLLLLASYSTADLAESSLDVLSIYGSEDNVLSAEKYIENKSNLPPDYTEFIIDGGCHAYFGMYGEQKDDGSPGISNQEQISITAEKIAYFITLCH